MVRPPRTVIVNSGLMSDLLIDVHYAQEKNRLLRMGQRKAMGEKLCLEHGQILTDDHIRNFHKVLEPLESVIAPLPSSGSSSRSSETSEVVELPRSYDPYLKLL